MSSSAVYPPTMIAKIKMSHKRLEFIVEKREGKDLTILITDLNANVRMDNTAYKENLIFVLYMCCHQLLLFRFKSRLNEDR